MKELIRDRIDVWTDKAKDGDARLQLRLAKCFHEGRLVEKSEDLAKYWAFKAILGGNRSAVGFYKTIFG